jgi:two-component system OmpR family sensor kinase
MKDASATCHGCVAATSRLAVIRRRARRRIHGGRLARAGLTRITVNIPNVQGNLQDLFSNTGDYQDMTMPIAAPRHTARRRIWEPLKQLSDRTPLRTKLITAMLALVIMALAAISITSVVVLQYLYTQRDGQLQAMFGHEMRDIAPGTPVALDYTYPWSGLILAYQQPGTQLVASNPGPAPPGMGTSRPAPSLPELPAGNWANSSNPVLTTVPAQSGGDTWRVIARAVPVINGTTNAQQTAFMVLAVDLGPVGTEIRRLITVELIAGTAIVIVLAVVGIAVVRANLRPLDDIEMTAAEISRGHLDHRIPERDPRTEIGSLGRSLNMMLSQIEAAFRAQHESERAAHESERAAHRSEERMRRFIADASHELRTPLTTIRGFAEYYRQRGGVRKDQDPQSSTDGGGSRPASGRFPDGLSPEDLDRLMRRLESEASRMGLLVEDLLQLARLDQQRPLDMTQVDMLTLAVDAVQDARIVAPDRRIDLEVAPGAAFLVEGDEQRLRQVIGNLVNNALTHTPPGTPVRVKIAPGTLIPPPGSAALDAGTQAGPPGGVPVPAVVLDVEDDGPGMTAEQAQRVFERFYRADQARNRASGGTGLGLAIVEGLVAAHGGAVSVRTAPGHGAGFQVKLPLSADAQAGELDDDEGP